MKTAQLAQWHVDRAVWWKSVADSVTGLDGAYPRLRSEIRRHLAMACVVLISGGSSKVRIAARQLLAKLEGSI